jgi:hypothetical protein
VPSALVGGRPEGRSGVGGWILLLGFLLQLAIVAEGFAQQAQPAEPRPVPLVKDITVDVDEATSNYVITASRDIELKDWSEKIEKPFRRRSSVK